MTEIERCAGRWRVGPAVVAVGRAAVRRRYITLRRIPALGVSLHMGSATIAPARSANYIAKHMCKHICEPIHSTGRILPGKSGITMCAENTAYIQLVAGS